MDRTDLILNEQSDKDRFIFVNFVDTDMVYGHRRDPQGYCDEVSRVDSRLRGFIEKMEEGDLMFITADHGCDPSYKGTDHTREHIPMLMYSKGGKSGNLGIRTTFADLAQTLADYFKVPPVKNGQSML